MIQQKNNSKNIGIIVEEFFHKDLRGFGGFGKTTQTISDYFNVRDDSFQIKVLLSQGLPVSEKPSIERYHNADVLLRPQLGPDRLSRTYISNFFKWRGLIQKMNVDAFMCIDYYPSYEHYLFADPRKPLLIYIRDPRSRVEWEKVGHIPSELKQRKKSSKEDLMNMADEKAASIHRMLKFSKMMGRKVVFATSANFLIERAKRTYNLPELKAHFLPNPIDLPKVNEVQSDKNPSLCFVGRLDAVKRFWIIFEMAKRFPNVTFYIMGDSSDKEVFNPIIQKYKNCENIKLLGHLDGEEKINILKKSWGMINTSIHEGYPVAFQESFWYGKPVISCQNPDGVVERYGYYTGEVLGEGDDASTSNRFAQKIEEFLTDEKTRKQKGEDAFDYAHTVHTFDNFKKHLKKILQEEKLIS